ncbi:uncharacterized mitochondrial protein AtMg00810-like [Glycine max]|uniref:uncharacterized mitochondrial protein AtMg00810-like n=1 Tax=Glycine max TaxID=3847 RepID=UPI001B357A2F|nr:uncharacterized mitochondrial protein AtMg00810-like [Glycine max]
MIDLGLMSYFLGIEVSQRNERIFISQKKYTEGLLKKFKMYGCKPIATPLITNEKLQKNDGAPEANASKYRSRIGSLLYLIATRLDIMYATSLLSRFMQSPSQIHFRAGKRILSYWAGLADNMKSTSGYAFSLGSGMFSWASKKQATVAQSTTEAEYVAAAETTSQAIWLRRILEDMGEKQDEPTKINCDNKSTIAMAKNLPLQLLKVTPFEVEVEMRDDFDTFEIEVKATRGPATRSEFVQIYKTKTIREFIQICKSKMFINDISRAKTLRSEIPKIYKT